MKTCSVENCERPFYAKGYCRQHWNRLRQYGRLEKIRGIEKPVCSVEGCTNISDSKGLCGTHYQRQHKFGRLHKIRSGDRRNHPHYAIWFERKQCGALVPEWLDFWTFAEDIGERPSPDHFLVRPRNEPYGPTNFEWNEKLRQQPGETRKQFNARQWQSRRQRFPLYEEDRYYRRKYGIDLNRYNEMVAKQNNVCAICFKAETLFGAKTGGSRRLAVDHCHKTGKVRELLCAGCNTTIGHIEKHSNDAKMIVSICDYLMRHKEDFSF